MQQGSTTRLHAEHAVPDLISVQTWLSHSHSRNIPSAKFTENGWMHSFIFIWCATLPVFKWFLTLSFLELTGNGLFVCLLLCSFVCLGKFIHPVSAPCGINFMGHMSQINEGKIPHPLYSHVWYVDSFMIATMSCWLRPCHPPELNMHMHIMGTVLSITISLHALLLWLQEIYSILSSWAMIQQGCSHAESP